MITISLCMIVKNEEKILARCLDSIADLVDEIIIVDTGSTDDTKRLPPATRTGSMISPGSGTLQRRVILPFPKQRWNISILPMRMRCWTGRTERRSGG